MNRLRKVLSVFAAAALLLPAGRAVARKPVFHHHRADHEGEERDHKTNRSAKPGKGNANGLTLHSRVLLDKAGKADVEVSTAPFDIGAVAPGNITEVELRSFDPRRRGDDDDKDGKGRFHKEFEHLREGGYVHWSFAPPALSHGQALRVRAEAKGSAHGRETEARWVDYVRYRPDLVVTMVDAPGLAPVNTLVQVTATVKEGKGELGAHADCVLLVDGVQADEIGAPIWVDAAGTSSCSFTTEFRSAGPHTITVRAQNVKPGDYDDSNNSFSRQIQVQSAATLYWAMDVLDQPQRTTTTIDSYYTSTSATPEEHFVSTSNNSSQSRMFSGQVPAAVGTVRRLSFTDRSAGTTLGSVSFDNPTFDSITPDNMFYDPAFPNSSVFNDVDGVNGRVFTVIRNFNASTNQGNTVISVAWFGSDMTFFSKNTCATLSLGCVPGDYTMGSTDGTVTTLGDDYAADFDMEDGASYLAHPAMPLTITSGSTTPVVDDQGCPQKDFHTGTMGKVCTKVESVGYTREGHSSVSPPATAAN